MDQRNHLGGKCVGYEDNAGSVSSTEYDPTVLRQHQKALLVQRQEMLLYSIKCDSFRTIEQENK